MSVLLEERPVEIETATTAVRPWADEVLRAIRSITQYQDTFTSDDVWALLELWQEPAPSTPALLTSVLRAAQRQGLCRRTDEHVRSRRPQARGRKVSVWQRPGGPIAALSAVRAVCDRRSAFTVDHVLATMESRGIKVYSRPLVESALEDAARYGWCRKTKEFLDSTRNGSQVVIWKSAPSPLPHWNPS